MLTLEVKFLSLHDNNVNLDWMITTRKWLSYSGIVVFIQYFLLKYGLK